MKKIRDHPQAGFTLVEIMIVEATIGLLAAIAVPNFVKARQTSQANVSVYNLRVIDEAKQQWALEKGTTSSPAPTDIIPYLGRAGTVMPLCPLSPGGTPAYNINILTAVPTCQNTTITGHTNAVLPF